MGVRAGRGPLGSSAALPSLALGSLAGLPSPAAERTKAGRERSLLVARFSSPSAGPGLEQGNLWSAQGARGCYRSWCP